MLKSIEFFWVRLLVIFNTFSEEVISFDMAVTNNIGNTSNNYFLLRAYLSFLGNVEKDEISIIVDVRLVEGVLMVESDVMGEDGKIVIHGPTLEFPFTTWPDAQSRCAKFLDDFEDFLLKNRARIFFELSCLR